MRLLENEAKAWLRKRGLPVPEGSVVSFPEEAGQQVELLGGRAAVKALIPAGRRGKAGAVRLVQSPDEARITAGEILGREISGFKVGQLFIERRVQVAREFYLSFAFDGLGPKVMASTSGGIDVEEIFEAAPGHIAHQSIDPRLGLRTWEAIELWDLAGLDVAMLPTIAGLTVRLYEAFRQADALMLEINPLAIDDTGEHWLVGAMVEIDDQALFRQPEWSERRESSSGEVQPNEREQQVILADRTFPGGAIRYTELDGDIGLLVAGGGAGLLQHDMIVAAGGRPANHSDISPTPSPEKPAAIIGAIFANPRTRALLIGYNFLQMARCDTVIRGLLIAMERHGVDPQRYPIVIRLFGPGEDEARALVSSVPGIQYLPHGASLEEGVVAILAAASNAKARAHSR